MTEYYFNSEPMDENEFYQALEESQEVMIHEEQMIQDQYEVSPQTASAILYLRTRSRWTQEKEKELVDRDHSGNPISLGAVLSGEF